MKIYRNVFIVVLILIPFCMSFVPEKDLINIRKKEDVRKRNPVLIAHRGGVVTPRSPECSVAAIKLAKEQGYDMVELDIRKSKDNQPIVFHDGNMLKACGIDKSIADLDFNEILKIGYLESDQKIVSLNEALKVCRSLNLGIMLDIKIKGDDTFFQEIVNLVKMHKLENACVTINSDPVVRRNFQEITLLTVTGEEFNKVQQGNVLDLSDKYWFGLPQDIPDEMVKALHENGALVIPAINTFRYPSEGHYELARKDIDKLNNAGVDGYQIDSVYRSLFVKEK